MLKTAYKHAVAAIIVTVKIDEFIPLIKQTFCESDDLKCRELTVAGVRCAFAYIDGGTDKLLLEQNIIMPLRNAERFEPPYLDALTQTVVYSEDITPVPLSNCAGPVAEGDVAFIIEDDETAYVFSLRKPEKRSVTEPPTSSVLKGPREGFIEELKTNLSILRRRIKTPDLAVRFFQVGRYSTTSVAVLHMHGIADDKIVSEICDKISRIDIDGVIDSAYVTSFIQSKKNSFFLQAGTTEKPDVAVAKMLEGRVAIIVDGSPMVLTLPYLFVEDMQSPGDYYENSTMTAFSRILRFISVLASVLLPALYVCLQVYNYQIIPLQFLITVMNASEAIPFSPLFEMMLVLVIFDILREANLRMPSAVGISLSLVGAIVLGDAAVKAGLLGAPAVMIGALSGIGLFTLPDNTLVLSLMRLIITFIGGTMGLLGVTLSIIAILLYLASLQNNKTPFLAPFAPNIPQDRQDAIGQKPVPQMTERPKSIPNKNNKRRG